MHYVTISIAFVSLHTIELENSSSLRVGLQCVIVVISDHTDLFFYSCLFVITRIWFWFDSLRPSQQLWTCRDGQFTLPHFFSLVSLTKRLTNTFYQSPLILTELFQHNLINVSYLTACYLYQVMMTLHFLNDIANDAESTQK